MPVLVGLGGYATAGKDAIANVLEPLGWKRTKMSHDLEQALLSLNPWVHVAPSNWKNPPPLGTHLELDFRISKFLRYQKLHEMVGYDRSKDNNDVREYLQKLGTEVGRKMFGETCWVDARMKVIDRWLAEGHNVVITGIRYPNELVAVQERGVNVWVHRPGVGPVNSHTSDNTLGPEDFDVVFVNGGTLDDLEVTVPVAVEDWLEWQ